MGYDFIKMEMLIAASGLSKKAFFSQIGMSEKTFANWVSGTAIPKESSVQKIASRLRVSLADLRLENQEDTIPTDTAERASIVQPTTVAKKQRKADPNLLASGEFSEEEKKKYRGHSTCIIFDTCSIMRCPELLDSVDSNAIVVVPKVVVHELEQHKLKSGHNEAGRDAQRAIAAIHKYNKWNPLAFADDNVNLVPESYRVDQNGWVTNDNKILSVVMRHKMFLPIPIVFITDDFSLSNKAAGEGVCVCTAEEFIRGEFPDPPPIEWGEKTSERDPAEQLKHAVENRNYNHAVLYSIILKKVNSTKKYINEQTDGQIKELAELYICLRTKKDVSTKKNAMFTQLKTAATAYLDAADMDALVLSFGAAYKDTLSSLSGAIKQIAGDLE